MGKSADEMPSSRSIASRPRARMFLVLYARGRKRIYGLRCCLLASARHAVDKSFERASRCFCSVARSCAVNVTAVLLRVASGGRAHVVEAALHVGTAVLLRLRIGRVAAEISERGAVA